MTVVVVARIPPGVSCGKHLSRQYLTFEFRDVAYARIDDRDCNSLTGAELPDIVGLHGVEMPLLLSDGLRMRWGRCDPSQQQTNQG
ncbi:hypothetical protein AB0F18_13800 [Streptomyces sp. NPDC029216]|uniref:hypothetical protein n=1 Tax=Streptomyces sp. NPDC029216 TaxID=3154701 RepID=UPI00340434F3